MLGRPKPAPYTKDVPMGAPASTAEDTPMSAFSTTTSKEWVDPYLEALGSDDDEWDDFEEETQARLAKATTSKTARIVQSILDGSYRNPTVALNMFEGSVELLRIRMIKAQGISPYIVLANINSLVSWLALGNTAVD